MKCYTVYSYNLTDEAGDISIIKTFAGKDAQYLANTLLYTLAPEPDEDDDYDDCDDDVRYVVVESELEFNS